MYDYPACQAALAQTHQDIKGRKVSRRFESFLNGMELANGYQELTDLQEQAHRFKQDNQLRAQLGKPNMPADQRLIDALQAGLPVCAGVAMGVERILMLAYKKQDIAEVLAFNHPLA